ncbi:MAG: DNA-formamidopyrimidine glycosylase family protein [Planctomycetota bacterium]
MPEGHTIHRIARDHTKWFAGQSLIISSPQGRFAEGAKKINGKQLSRVDAHGKHLFYRFAGKTKRSEKTIHVHLGLYGKFRIHKNPPPEPRGAVRVRMIGESRSFDLNGPSRCEIYSTSEQQKLLARLGPDPLRDDADVEQVWNRISRSRASIGTLLLNQAVVAGIGNVYRAELLHLMGIHPERPGNEISREQFDELWDLTVKLLNVGVKYNRIITVPRESIGKPLSRLNSSERLFCYKKNNCCNCNGKIKNWKLGARTMYACPRCQK